MKSRKPAAEPREAALTQAEPAAVQRSRKAAKASVDAIREADDILSDRPKAGEDEAPSKIERDTARYEALAREHGANLSEEGFNDALRKVSKTRSPS